MENDSFKKIHPSARKVWTINGIIESIVILAIAFTVFYFLKRWFIPAAAGGLCLYIVLLHPMLEYRQWSYRITDTCICYNHGIYTKSTTIIPISRIQHLEIKQGPVLKHYSLSNIQIYTAGQAHTIAALLTTEAEGIADSINQLISKEDTNGK